MVNIIRRSGARRLADEGFDWDNEWKNQWLRTGKWTIDDDHNIHLLEPITGVDLTNIGYNTQYDISRINGKLIVSSPSIPSGFTCKAEVSGGYNDDLYYANFQIAKDMESSAQVLLSSRPGWKQITNQIYAYEDPNMNYKEYDIQVVGLVYLYRYEKFQFIGCVVPKETIYGNEPRPYVERTTDNPYITQVYVNVDNCMHVGYNRDEGYPRGSTYPNRLEACVDYVEKYMKWYQQY